LFSPPVSCDWLSVTFYDELLETCANAGRIITRDDLRRVSAFWLVNSVRKWRKAILE
jgi:para-aminobenzoate synthetase/4-amino-4-deoxychorismate lyase